jgi:hypothetical protein
MTIYSGFKFIDSQKNISSAWKGKIHNYLSDEEYQELVAQPIKEASDNYKSYVAICSVAVIILSLTVFLFALHPVSSN